MKKERKKYRVWINDDNDGGSMVPISEGPTASYHTQGLSEGGIPPQLTLPIRNGPGFFLGLPNGLGESSYIGVPQGVEGNIVVVGGNGSGKSAGVAKPTLMTWQGTMCVTDIKGELSDSYEGLYRKGLVTHPYIIFDPTQLDGPSYDPFWWLLQDGSNNLVNNIQELALAIIPLRPDEKEPFWTETERGVLAAALLYYFELGLSFSETICQILGQALSTLCEELTESSDIRVRMFLGEMADMKGETLASVDRGLRNKIMLFAMDPYISHVFRGSREGAECVTWDDLNSFNIFLRIPAHRIEQWSGAINLMYTQLIRYLERRPEMYSPEGANNVQTLLLMDEFARFGKLEMITAALATLRSKNVNICLMVQSIAQLDKIYGEHDRRILFDNCAYQAVLRANDADTQKYLAELVGTHMSLQRSASEHEDDFGDTTGYSKQLSEIRELVVQPHELATLDDVLLLTPYGFCRAKKFLMTDAAMLGDLPNPSARITIQATARARREGDEGNITCVVRYHPPEFIPSSLKTNGGAIMMSINERTANANKHIEAAERKHRQEERAAQEAQKKKDSRRNYIIGELVARYFPLVREYEPGTDAENQTRFESLEAFLYVLSTDYELVRELQERADQLMSEDPDGEWRLSE